MNDFEDRRRDVIEQGKFVRKAAQAVIIITIIMICVSVVFFGVFWATILKILNNLGLL